MRTLQSSLVASILGVACCVPQHALGAIPAAQRQALLDLYASTSGDGWEDHANWLGPEGSECTWHGITCDAGETTVTAVKLTRNNLAGVLPDSIGDLSGLEELALGSNRLSGGIPASIGNMTGLRSLVLYANMLQGQIPASMSSLVALEANNSDLDFNALYTDDPALAAFLDSAQDDGDWQGTQTVAPGSVTATATSVVAATLSWTSLGFTDGLGGYEIFAATLPGGPFTLLDRTASKLTTSWTVWGLAPGVTHYFKLRTVSEPYREFAIKAHPGNDNAVYSTFSEVVSVNLPGGSGFWHVSTAGVPGNDCASPATACPTIQDAIDLASAGEEVRIAPGTYHENLTISAPLHLVGEDPATTNVDGGAAASTLTLTGADALVEGLTLKNGHATTGGGVNATGSANLRLSNCVVDTSSAQSGGGLSVDSDSSALLDNVEVHHNTATESGGGILNQGYLRVVDGTVRQNTAAKGGGIANIYSASIVRTSLHDNDATGNGGGLAALGISGRSSFETSISASSIYANRGGGDGAGIYAFEAVVRMTNTTLSGNTGIGIYAFFGCNLASTNSTIAHNAGLGLYSVASAHLWANGTIFSGNRDGSCVNLGAMGSNNIASDNGCFAIAADNQTNTDPLLLPLADNGGPTLTHALQDGSPAIDHGYPFQALPTDQRGSIRPLDGDQDGTSLPDAGAFEYQPVGLIFVDGFEGGDLADWSLSVP